MCKGPRVGAGLKVKEKPGGLGCGHRMDVRREVGRVDGARSERNFATGEGAILREVGVTHKVPYPPGDFHSHTPPST